jgi:DNA-binding transcriptional regulator YiaG
MIEQPPLDFTKVETLRRHMLLTTGDMSTLFGVSRMTYYGWVKGKPLRKSNDVTVRRVLKQLLDIMKNHHWPMPEVIASEQRERFSRLQELLNT